MRAKRCLLFFFEVAIKGLKPQPSAVDRHQMKKKKDILDASLLLPALKKGKRKKKT